MPYLAAFGAYVPERVVTNAEVAEIVGCEADWIRGVSGISERRWAGADETVVTMGVAAARDCLAQAGAGASPLDLLIVSCGSTPRRFPGPAAEIAKALALDSTPAIDLPLASAGTLFGLAVASRMPGRTLVIGTEKMSEAVLDGAPDKDTAILFGDGAGACLVTPEARGFRVLDWLLESDGSFTGDLQLGLTGPVRMNGRTVILQAVRKVPRAILQLLGRNAAPPADVAAYLMHQANLNLLERLAKGVVVPAEKFFSNIARYGNTSSASLLIAAREWEQTVKLAAQEKICLAAFGAGFHWGALLAEAV